MAKKLMPFFQYSITPVLQVRGAIHWKIRNRIEDGSLLKRVPGGGDNKGLQ
jgi:hypothetical protein